MKILYLAGAAMAFSAVPAAADHHASGAKHAEADTTGSTPAPRFVRSEVTQTTPAGYQSADGEELPVCAEGQQDGCINSFDKDGTGNRPLEYWPGRPASEIDGPLPATKEEFDSMEAAEAEAEEADQGTDGDG